MRALQPAILSAARRAWAALVPVLVAAALSPARGAEPDPRVPRALQALREDASSKVRAQAAFALARLGARETVPALRRALLEDEAPVVRVAAATALGRLGGGGGLEALRDVAARDGDAAVRAAASRALDELLRGARTVSIDAVEGKVGDAGARAQLHEALARELLRHGFAVVDDGARYQLKPSVLLLQESRAASGPRLEVKASVVAVEPSGRIAAIVEGGAIAGSSAGGAPGRAAAPLAQQAFEAAAGSISDDLARRLLELP